jgi:hypothetical protein
VQRAPRTVTSRGVTPLHAARHSRRASTRRLQ